MTQIKINPIVPKHMPFNPDEYEKAIETAFTASAQRIQTRMEEVSSTWKKKPTFRISGIQKTAKYLRMGIGTDNPLWGWLDKGTPTRYIVPRKKKFLRFNVPHGAKTTPGLLTSKSGFVGSTVVFAKRVKHRIRARGFNKLIAKQEQPRIQREVDAALRNVARRAK